MDPTDMTRPRFVLAVLLTLVVIHLPASLRAETCSDICGLTCVKPLAVADRWDDAAPIAGYPAWANNGNWDHEAFTDQNGNRLYDAGEPFVDANTNGAFDAETYDPIVTGYIANPDPGNLFAPGGDIGTSLTIAYPTPGHPLFGYYTPVGLPPSNRGIPEVGGTNYRDNIVSCDTSVVWAGDQLDLLLGNMVGPSAQGLQEVMDLDPGASYDPGTKTVQNSAFVTSPRILLIPLHDPRIDTSPLVVVKVVAFFMEQLNIATVQGRFVKLQAAAGFGTACSPGSAPGGSFVTHCVANQPPDCSGAVASEPVLWPPNHGYHAISVQGVTDPDGDAVSITVTGITQDEVVNGKGDGNTCPDAQVVSGQAAVRAERSGSAGKPGNGRIYAISFTADDGHGGTCNGVVNVCVPSDITTPTCVDDGQLHNSLGTCSSGSKTASLVVATVTESQAEVAFAVPSESSVNVSIYDVSGRRLATLENSTLPEGNYSRTWNMTGVPRGLYFVLMRMNATTLKERILKLQ